MERKRGPMSLTKMLRPWSNLKITHIRNLLRINRTKSIHLLHRNLILLRIKRRTMSGLRYFPIKRIQSVQSQIHKKPLLFSNLEHYGRRPMNPINYNYNQGYTKDPDNVIYFSMLEKKNPNPSIHDGEAEIRSRIEGWILITTKKFLLHVQ